MLTRAYDNELERYAELLEIYYSVDAGEKAQAVAKLWEKLLKKQRRKNGKSQHAKYHEGMAWKELVFGDAGKALESFEKAFVCRVEAGDDVDG